MAVLNWTRNDVGAASGNWIGLGVAGTETFVMEDPWGGTFADPVASTLNAGASWSAGTTSTAFKPYAAAYNGTNRVIVVGSGHAAGTGLENYRRVAGVWSACGALPTAALYFSIAWNGTTFCATRNGAAATTTDGAAWTARVCAVTGDSRIIAHNTKFVAIGDGDANCYVSSDNGVTFVSHAMPSSGWQDLVSNGTRIVAVGADKVAYSDDDGGTWTQVVVVGTWYGVEWNGSMFCMISGAAAQFATSSTGAGWTVDTIPFASSQITFESAIGVVSGNFVFLGFRSGSPFYALYTSAPGFSEFWTNEGNCEETDA